MNELHIDKTHWKRTKIGDLLYKTEYNDKENASKQYSKFIKMEHLDANSLNIHRWGDSSVEDIPPTFYKIFKKGQILYPTRNPQLRRAALASFDGICGEKTLTLSLIEGCEGYIPFIAHVFHSSKFIEYATNARIGSTNPHIRWRDVADYEFLLPPKAEQKRLAELLWAADEVVEKEKRVIQGLEKLYYSTISDVFRNQPKHCKLGSLCEIKSGFAFPLKYQGKKDLPIPFFKVADMNHPNNRFEMMESDNYVDDNILKAIKGQTYPAGTLVFPKIGATINTDKKRMLSTDSVVDNNIMVLIPNKKQLDSHFLFYFFNTFKLSDIINTGAVPTISAETVRNIQIPDLDIEEQNSIANQIDTIRLAISQQRQVIKQSQQIKQELINKVFKYENQKVNTK
jgi:type I restriction enzyme S subunit